MSDQEQRRFQRVPFHAWVELLQNGQTRSARLLDVSLKGLLLEAPEDTLIDPDQPVRASIQLEGDATITMHARLSHRQGLQLGFKCEIIDVDSISHLRRLIELNLGDAKAAERELSELAAVD